MHRHLESHLFLSAVDLRPCAPHLPALVVFYLPVIDFQLCLVVSLHPILFLFPHILRWFAEKNSLQHVCLRWLRCVCARVFDVLRMWADWFLACIIFHIGAWHGESSPAPYRAKMHICILWIMELNLREWDASWKLSSLTPFIVRRHTVDASVSPLAQSGSLRLAHLLWHSYTVLLSLFYDVHVI